MSKAIDGRVIQVGWEPDTSDIERIYVLVKVRIATTKRQDRAERQLKTLTKKVLGKKVVIFPEG